MVEGLLGVGYFMMTGNKTKSAAPVELANTGQGEGIWFTDGL